jgi:hypothetical protein
VLSAAFSSYSLALLCFCQKNFGPKVASKMLVKLTTGVNFINVKLANFFYERHFVTRKKLPKPMFVRKIHAFNVGEIDTWAVENQLFFIEI